MNLIRDGLDLAPRVGPLRRLARFLWLDHLFSSLLAYCHGGRFLGLSKLPQGRRNKASKPKFCRPPEVERLENRFLPTGVSPLTSYATSSTPYPITLGPDGNLWFGESDMISNITPAGVVTNYYIPSGPSQDYFSTANGITTGSDGNLWFTVPLPEMFATLMP